VENAVNSINSWQDEAAGNQEAQFFPPWGRWEVTGFWILMSQCVLTKFTSSYQYVHIRFSMHPDLVPQDVLNTTTCYLIPFAQN
jgi:hypothetical protein